MSAFTRSSKFSALGLSPQEAIDTVGSMRELGGASNISSAQAYRATKLGTDIGLSNQDLSAIGGQAGRLGIDPAREIDIVAKGVEAGMQRGLQGEVGRATLDYLRQQSRLGTADERKAAETVTGVAALLGASGIRAFQGEGAISQGVAGITSANQPGDLFGVESVGQAYTTIGQTRLLQSINRDPRFKNMSPLDRAAMTDRILTQVLTGPNSRMYLRDVVAPEIEQAKAQGPAATVAMAGHAAARASTGASALGTYTGIENLEASLVRKMAISRESDTLIGSGMSKVAGALDVPSSVTGSGMPDYGHMTTWAAAAASAASASGPPPSPLMPGGGDARDSTLNNVGDRIVAALNVLIQAVAASNPATGFSAPPTSASTPTPASLAPAHDHGPIGPTASTPKSRRH